MPRKNSLRTSEEEEREMHHVKSSKTKSGKGGKGGAVKNRAQAIALDLSRAHKAGKKAPQKSAAA